MQGWWNGSLARRSRLRLLNPGVNSRNAGIRGLDIDKQGYEKSVFGRNTPVIIYSLHTFPGFRSSSCYISLSPIAKVKAYSSASLSPQSFDIPIQFFFHFLTFSSFLRSCFLSVWGLSISLTPTVMGTPTVIGARTAQL